MARVIRTNTNKTEQTFAHVRRVHTNTRPNEHEHTLKGCSVVRLVRSPQPGWPKTRGARKLLPLYRLPAGSGLSVNETKLDA
jgi:hypothetical protein